MKYSDHFTCIAPEKENLRVILRNSAPEKLKELIRHIHVDSFHECFPNDWIYLTIQEAFEELEDNDLTGAENLFDLDLSMEADVYNYDLQKWLFENGNAYATEYCNQAMEGNIYTDIMKVISEGQYMAKRAIYEAVFDFIKENGNEIV